MRTYVIRRVLLIIPTLLIVSMIIFIVMRLIPGDIIDLMLAERGGSISSESDEAMRAIIEKRLGLDAPIHIQYGRWLKNILLHGDLGMSLWRDTPVRKEIFARIPVTVELSIFGILTALIISFPIGIYSAMRQDTAGDYLGRTFAIACIAIPSFWLGTLAVVFPSIWLNWSPPIMYIPFFEDQMGNLTQFAIPGIILGMTLCGTNMRMVRTMVLEILRQDYIRTAWSKGLSERTIIVRHVLKNALVPVVTLIGLMVPGLVSGAVILENIFTLPGMGRLLLDAALVRDYTITSGVVLTFAVIILIVNLAVDLTYAYLDPRIQYE
jgi:peptide/nickel transport system permease protein